VHVQKQAVTPATDKNNGKINGKADNTKENAEKSAAQSPATGSNVAGIALAVMVLAVAAGVLIVLRRKEAGDR
jgi:pullulanase